MGRKAKSAKTAKLIKMFESYTYNKMEIDRRLLDSCQVSDSVRGSSADPPFGEHTIHIAGVDKSRAERNARCIARLNNRIACVDLALQNATPRIRTALTLYYLDGLLEWDEVAEAMQAEYPDLTAGAIKRAAYRYLNKC